MVKKFKSIKNQECTNVRFYLLAIVAIVAIVAVFAVYIGTNYTGEATTKVKSKGSTCTAKMDNCEHGCNITTSKCLGAPLGIACGSNSECEIGRCDMNGLKKTCGGSGATCKTNSECASGNCIFLRYDKVYKNTRDVLGECK